MGKLRSLIGGTLLGAGGMYVGLQYHVLLAPEGPLLVPRTPQHSLKEAYAEVSTWNTKTWAEHPQISLAVTQHGRADLIGDGVQRGILDELRSTFTTPDEQVSTSTRGWTPVSPPEAPSPIANGRVADTESGDRETPPRRSLLPLAELFGFRSHETRDNSPADEKSTRGPNSVLPTGTTNPPVVELLPAPDEVDLGQPQPLPRRPHSQWRQSDANDEDKQRTASGQPDTETLSDLPSDLKSS